MASLTVHRVGVGLLEPRQVGLSLLSKRGDHNSSESPLEPMTSATPSTTSEPEQAEVVELASLPPTVSDVESHSATFSWAPLGKVPPGLMAVYAIELQQLETPESVPSTNWLSVYKGEQLSCKVDELKSGRRYAARLVASVETGLNAEELGVEVRIRNGDHILFQTPATVPSSIQPPSLSQRARNALKLKWNVPEDPGGQFELTYVLQISPAPLGLEDQRTQMGFVEVYRGPERSYKVTKLQPGVRYTSRVQAVNPLGEGPFSLCSAYTTQATVPAAPEPPTVQAAASNALTLQWNPPADNGSPIIGYGLERDDGCGGDFMHCYVGPNTWHTVKNLRAGTVYRFRLRADNDEGRSMWSQTASLMTGAAPPDSPVALQVVTPLTTSATLAWSAPENDYGSRVVAYEVELQAISRAAVACMGSAWLKIFEGEALACTINSLCPGCTYSVRVRARNSAGWGAWAVPVSLTTAPDVPEAPLSLQPTGCSPTTIVISWAPPRHDGGAKVLTYRMEMAPAECLCGRCPQALSPGGQTSMAHGPQGVQFSAQPSVSPGSPSGPVRPTLCKAQAPLVVYDRENVGAELRHLQPGSGYIFRLQAVNAQGPGPWTDWVAGATAPDVPATPAPPAVTGWASGALILSWQAPPGQGSPVSSYTVEVAPLPQMPNYGPPGPAGIIADQRLIASLRFKIFYRGPHTSCEVRGLEPKCAYALRLCAHNDVGPSTWSVCTAAITSHAPPTCPVSVSAQPVSSCKIVLCWMPPERDNGAAVLSYTVDMAPVPRNLVNKPLGGNSFVSWSHLYTGPACACSAEGLAPSRTYQFRVRATNLCGCGPSSPVVTATTLAAVPSAPGKPVILARAANNVRVRWDEPEHSNGAVVMSYVVEAAPVDSDEWKKMYEGPETTVRVLNLQPATKYTLRVAATNAVGQGPFGESESVTTAMMAPLPPSEVSASEITEDVAAALAGLGSTDVAGSSLEAGPSLLVTWRESMAAAPHAAAMGYEVEARPKVISEVAGLPAGGVVKVTVAGRRCEARLEGLAPGCTYCVRVRSIGVDGTGHSGWSEEASVSLQQRPDAETVSVCSSAPGTLTCSNAAPRKGGTAARRAAKRQQQQAATAAAAAAAAAACSGATSLVAAAVGGGAGLILPVPAQAPSTSGDEAVAPAPVRQRKAGSAVKVKQANVALPRPKKGGMLDRAAEQFPFLEAVLVKVVGRNWRSTIKNAVKQGMKAVKLLFVIGLLFLGVYLVWSNYAPSPRH